MIPYRSKSAAGVWVYVDEIKMVLGPMGDAGEEPAGSMGNDTPLAVLSRRPQLLFSYFRQMFAQVTNPAHRSHSQQLVMSLAMNLGPQEICSRRRPSTPSSFASLSRFSRRSQLPRCAV